MVLWQNILLLECSRKRVFWKQNILEVEYSGTMTPEVLRDMPTEVYCTRTNTLLVEDVWMVTDVYGKIKGMKID